MFGMETSDVAPIPSGQVCAGAPRNDGVGFLEGQAMLAPLESRLVIANSFSPEAISSN
jgi:hypothetical protein